MLTNHQKSILLFIYKSVTVNVFFNNALTLAFKYNNNPHIQQPLFKALSFSFALTLTTALYLSHSITVNTNIPVAARREDALNKRVELIGLTVFTPYIISLMASMVLPGKKSLFLATTLIPIAIGLLTSAAFFHEEIGNSCSRLFRSRGSYQPVNNRAENPNFHEAPANQR